MIPRGIFTRIRSSDKAKLVRAMTDDGRCIAEIEEPSDASISEARAILRALAMLLDAVNPVPIEPTAEMIADGVRHVPLTRGSVAIVDEADYELVMLYKWHLGGDSRGRAYAVGRLPGRKSISMHRLLMNPPSGQVVDHINGNPVDNRRANLRVCSAGENSRNRTGYQNRNSQYVGVRRVGKGDQRRTTTRWVATVGGSRSGTLRHLGVFLDEEEAARVRDAAARELYGEFGRYNFPLPGERPVTEPVRIYRLRPRPSDTVPP